MARTATTEEVAAALRVGPATVRKYAREHRLPYDVTPGGHRRFDVQEAVAALLGDQRNAATAADGTGLPEPVPYVAIPPADEVSVTATVTAVTQARLPVHDGPDQIEDWATETPVV